MARVTEEGIRGMIGPIVFYNVRGKTYARTKGRVKSGKRKKAMNPLNSIFGIVSRFGSEMTKTMRTSFLFPFNRDTYNKVRGWMRNNYAEHKDDEAWELSGRMSGMCQLNPEVDIRDNYKTDLTITDAGNGNIIIDFPAFHLKRDFKYPNRTQNLNLKLIALTSTFKEDGHPCKLCTEQHSFSFNNDPVPAKSFELKTNAGTGDIALIVMAIEYQTQESGNDYNKEMKWLPAAIIAMGRLK